MRGYDDGAVPAPQDGPGDAEGLPGHSRREFVVSLPVEEGRDGPSASSDLADHVVFGSGLYGDQVRVRSLSGEDWFSTRLGRDRTG